MDRGHVPDPRADTEGQARSGGRNKGGVVDPFFRNELHRSRIEALIVQKLDATVVAELDNKGREIVMKPSDAQVKFFDKLLEEKDFGDTNTVELRTSFAGLNQKSASVWIERAISLPKRDESGEEVVAPTF